MLHVLEGALGSKFQAAIADQRLHLLITALIVVKVSVDESGCCQNGSRIRLGAVLVKHTRECS